MWVGTIQAPELKELAEQKSLPFANMLRSYALEDMLLRISDSEYRDHLWLTDDGMLGEEGCRREGEGVNGAKRAYIRGESKNMSA